MRVGKKFKNQQQTLPPSNVSGQVSFYCSNRGYPIPWPCHQDTLSIKSAAALVVDVGMVRCWWNQEVDEQSPPLNNLTSD